MFSVDPFSSVEENSSPVEPKFPERHLIGHQLPQNILVSVFITRSGSFIAPQTAGPTISADLFTEFSKGLLY